MKSASRVELGCLATTLMKLEGAYKTIRPEGMVTVMIRIHSFNQVSYFLYLKKNSRDLRIRIAI